MADRDLDVVVHGATGFVGELTAAHLAAHAPEGTRIGLSGRSRDKLEAVRGRLGHRADGWPLLVADAADEPALRALAARTAVVATTVGPYASYGLPLVRACAEAGTHYADLTGEVLFVRRAIDAAHETARASGARLVTSCGFDSVPSDLGVLLLHRAATEAGAGELTDVTLALTGARGGFSGGTVASLTGQLTEMRGSAEARRLALDPYALSPDRAAEPDLGPQRDLHGIAHDADVGWTAPFVMASYNTRVVRRSNALLDHGYGAQLRYREVMAFGGGPAGLAKAGAVTAGLGAAIGGLAVAPRRLLDRVLPAPGTGPDEEARSKGYFRVELHGRTTGGAHLVARVAASGDPGYAATAVMLGESALALAGDGLPEAAGVLTPATGIGTALVDRLRARGFTLEAGPAGD